MSDEKDHSGAIVGVLFLMLVAFVIGFGVGAVARGQADCKRAIELNLPHEVLREVCK